MTFREILGRLVEGTPGALAGAIMGRDGIPLDEYAVQPGAVDLAAVAIEFEGVLTQADKVSAAVFPQGAGLEELVLVAGDNQILFRPIDDEYFLVVVLERTGVLGKARYLLRSLLEDVQREL